jgi:hypothetical protein
MLLDTGLVFLVDEWNLEGHFVVHLPGVDWVQISLELDLVALGGEFQITPYAHMDWHFVLVCDWDTEQAGEFHDVFAKVECLLPVDWESIAEMWEGGVLKLGHETIDFLLVEGEKTLHFVVDLEVERANNLVSHFAVGNSKKLANLQEVLVSLSVTAGWNPDLLVEVVEQFLSGVSVERELEWVESEGTIAKHVEVSEVNVIRDP